ncbi:MAG: nitroreductase family protein [Coriobacteriales bacterium]|jgi:nitroreductase|nr:nitroreductase family protein [Coriobacteriales bacterium]
MNETLKTIAERYTCRSFTGTPVKREELEAITLAGAQAPTAANSQRFRIIVIDNKDYIDELDARMIAIFESQNPGAMDRIRDRGGKALYNASAMIFLAVEHSGPWSADLDGGIVIQNMVLAAHSLEVGSCINAMCRVLFEGEAGAEFKKQLQFPDGFDFCCGILFGYPTDFGRPHAPATDKIIWL